MRTPMATHESERETRGDKGREGEGERRGEYYITRAPSRATRSQHVLLHEQT